MSSIFQNVRLFQEQVLGNEFPDKPQKIEGELLEQTTVRLNEELEEFMDADTIADQADALCDLIYFAVGAMYQAGIPAGKVWNAVHNANMTKRKGRTKRGDNNDAAKPEDFQAPDHSWLDEGTT